MRAVLVMCVVMAHATVCAQDLTAQARQAAAEGRLIDADRLFTESLERDPSVATAYNLALVKQNRGRFVDARRLFEQLLGGEFGALPRERRAVVAERLADATARLAVVVVRLDAPSGGELRVDGRAEGSVVPGATVRTQVDPGTHVVVVRLDDGRERRIPIEVDEGDHVEHEVHFEALPRSATRRRWTIGLSLAAVVLAATAVGLGVGLRGDSSSQLPDPPEFFAGTAEALQTQ